MDSNYTYIFDAEFSARSSSLHISIRFSCSHKFVKLKLVCVSYHTSCDKQNSLNDKVDVASSLAQKYLYEKKDTKKKMKEINSLRCFFFLLLLLFLLRFEMPSGLLRLNDGNGLTNVTSFLLHCF